MIEKVKVLGIGIKKEGSELINFVDTDIFDKRKKRICYMAKPHINLHSDSKELSKVRKKLDNLNSRFGYDIFLAELIVEVDLSLIYKNENAVIDKVCSNRIYISSESGVSSGYQYFNNDKCIISKEIKEVA